MTSLIAALDFFVPFVMLISCLGKGGRQDSAGPVQCSADATHSLHKLINSMISVENVIG